MNLVSGRRGRLTYDTKGDADDWDDIPIGSGFNYEPDNSSEHFEMIEMSEAEIALSGGGFGTQTRWALLTPLACTVLHRVDSINFSDETPEWSEGDEEQEIILPDTPGFINLPAGGVDDGYKLILLGIIWHPWT